MSVAKSIEILAQGDTLEDATEEVLKEASKSVENIKNIYVDDYRAIVENGEIKAYRVHSKVTFVIHE